MSSGARELPDRRRFHRDEYRNLEDISDPHTEADETTTSLRERAKGLWPWGVLAGGVGTIALVVVIGYTWHLIPEIASNRYVQIAAAVMAIFFTGALLADKRRRNVLKRYQWLVLDTPEGPMRFLGSLKQDAYGDPVFVPAKGFGRFRTTARPYTIAEFGQELADSWSKFNRESDDPARIRLEPAFVSRAETHLGTVITQPTEGVEVDPMSRYSTLQATPPEFIDHDAADDLRTELTRLREEVTEYQSLKNDLERRLENAKDIGAMTPEEFTERQIEFYERIRSVETGRGRSKNGEGGAGAGIPSAGPDRELEQLEQELMADD